MMLFNFKHKTEIISLILIFFALVMYTLSNEKLDLLSLLIGVSLAAIPFRILYWSEKGSEANRIAFHLRQDLNRFKEEIILSWINNFGLSIDLSTWLSAAKLKI